MISHTCYLLCSQGFPAHMNVYLTVEFSISRSGQNSNPLSLISELHDFTHSCCFPKWSSLILHIAAKNSKGADPGSIIS
jgi:hypothetical protein